MKTKTKNKTRKRKRNEKTRTPAQHTNLVFEVSRVVADSSLVAAGSNGVRQHCLVDAPVSVPPEVVGVIVDLFRGRRHQNTKGVTASSIQYDTASKHSQYSQCVAGTSTSGYIHPPYLVKSFPDKATPVYRA